MEKGLMLLLAATAGFFAGGMVGSATVPEGVGLAAGATVFLWAMGGSVVLLVLSIRIARRLSAARVRMAVFVLLAVNCVFGFLLMDNTRQAEAGTTSAASASRQVTTLPAAARYPHLKRADLPAGLGILVISPLPGATLSFHSEPGVAQQPDDYPPVAEVRFGVAVPSVDILEAPARLVPEHLKMDYEIFHLRAITLTPGWVEVVGNSTTGETWWVDRTQGRFVAWPEFLVAAAAVIPFEDARIHARPLDDSPVLATTTQSLQPLAVRGDWLKVSISQLADRMPPEGWLRWRDDDRLLVSYKPLG